MIHHATSFAAALFCAAALAGATPAIAAPITQAQGDAILQELKQIRQLLERPPVPQPVPQAVQAPPPAPEKVTIKLGAEYSLGRADAPVTIIEYNDLQCPFCNRFYTGAFAEIKKNYVDTGKVRFINRDMPLVDLHPFAMQAAQASRCAGDQGKYWEVADNIITHQAGLSAQSIDQIAKDSGIDAVAYRTCMESGRHLEAIRESAAGASALGISGTPSFVIGSVEGGTLTGQKLVGAMPFATFEVVIKELLGGR